MASTGQENGQTAELADAGKSVVGDGRGGLSSFTLKAVAIVGMTANHAAYIFGGQLPFWASCLLIGLGGLTFPIMAFLLVEGYHRTSNVKRYALRLAAFALVSQIPYGLFLADNGNVLFTLLIGLGVLYADEHVKNRSTFWVLAAGGALASLACDWGFIGVVMILLFKMLGTGARPPVAAAEATAAPSPARTESNPDIVPAALRTPLGAVAAPVLLVVLAEGLPTFGALMSAAADGDWSLLPFVLYPLVGCPLTIPLLYAYRGRRGLPMKWFFYAYYPLHIAVLGLIHLVLFGA